MKKWMLSAENAAGEAIATEEELDTIRKDAKKRSPNRTKESLGKFCGGN